MPFAVVEVTLVIVGTIVSIAMSLFVPRLVAWVRSALLPAASRSVDPPAYDQRLAGFFSEYLVPQAVPGGIGNSEMQAVDPGPWAGTAAQQPQASLPN